MQYPLCTLTGAFHFICTVIYCLSTSHYRLTLEQLEQLLKSSTTTNSPNTYIIMSDGRIFHQTSQYPPEFGLYNLIRSVYSDTRINTPKGIWLNKAPCPVCAETLYQVFENRGKLPTLHLETLNFNDNNPTDIMKGLGCLAKLHYLYRFPVQAWNWTKFSNDLLAERHHCTMSINTSISDHVYTASKSLLEKFLLIIQDLRSFNKVQDLCK